MPMVGVDDGDSTIDSLALGCWGMGASERDACRRNARLNGRHMQEQQEQPGTKTGMQ